MTAPLMRDGDMNSGGAIHFARPDPERPCWCGAPGITSTGMNSGDRTYACAEHGGTFASKWVWLASTLRWLVTSNHENEKRMNAYYMAFDNPEMAADPDVLEVIGEFNKLHGEWAKAVHSLADRVERRGR